MKSKCPDEKLSHAQDDVNPHNLRMLEGTSSLDTGPYTSRAVRNTVIWDITLKFFFRIDEGHEAEPFPRIE